MIHRVIGVLTALWLPAAAAAQSASLTITVVDPSGAVIVGAKVDVRPVSPVGAAAVSVESGSRGEASFMLLEPGRYTIHVESAGFEPGDVRDFRVRTGDNSRTIKLQIAKFAETVQVGRDPRERASDPRSDAFATILGQAEINELPDDPDEMEQVLKDMAGPGAVLRLNGFRGGRLPPKDQIAQIRFRRNMFAADAHEPGFIAIDVTTKPGLDAWRGSTNIALRGDALSAKNAFAPVKGDERNSRAALSINGPLWKQHTSLSIAIDGTDAYDTKTIVAQTPAGFYNDSVQRPTDALNLSTRLEHALSPAQMLRVEVQRNHTRNGNLGVGDYDLPERAYSQRRDENLFRASVAGSIRKALFNEFRFQWRGQEILYNPSSALPAVMVLNAFNSGGAQLDGGRHLNEVELADDLDVAIGRHAMRTGALIEYGRYDTFEYRNAGGTFTFSGLDAFDAGRPTTFTRNAGDPRVAVDQLQSALYFQDDFRATKSLTLSGGLRQEYQTHIGGLHLGPRGGAVWSPFRNGKTTIRGGAGYFFDWFDAQIYQQAVQLDGSHQQIQTVVDPGYPNPLVGPGALPLPNGRVQLAPNLEQPVLKEANIAIEQQFPHGLRVNTMYIRRRGDHALRGVNINAPNGGIRPEPTAGTITDIQSTAALSFDALNVGLNLANMERRIFVALNYQLSRTINDTDSPFSLAADAANLSAERGPALFDARHRLFGFTNFPLFSRRLTMGWSYRLQSGLPYNITTGKDDNGDTISNDRPVGVTRNSARGTATVDISTRVAWKMGLGSAAAPGTAGPQVRIVRAGSDTNVLGDMMTGDANKRYAIELYAQVFNLLNHTNAIAFSGVMTSPFFGQATSAAPPRRAEIGARLSF